ncbi:hypothetical protein ASD79_23000 [Caulobacter sp. Root655]|nr:hypothetical protein ASD79_23000 [Caulobacter sp. Root655]
MEGKLPDEKIDRAVKTMESWATSWPCDGEIGAVFFTATVNLHATVNGVPLKFFGNAGGIFGLGGDKIGGVLFSDNILALFFNTKTFEYHGFPHYTGVVFFDDDFNVLGHFEGDGIGLAGGLGGGLGGWNWDG